MFRNSQPVRWWVPLVAIGIAWLLTLLGGCAGNNYVPMVQRPDTRRIILVSFDTTALTNAINLFRTSSPIEAAVCWRGVVSPFVLDGVEWLRVDVQDFYLPAVDSATEYNVFFPRGIPSGCVGSDFLGVSHSHTNPSFRCTHSNDDAAVLFYTRRALFSIVFCANGDAEMLYQDGRRAFHRYIRE